MVSRRDLPDELSTASGISGSTTAEEVLPLSDEVALVFGVFA